MEVIDPGMLDAPRPWTVRVTEASQVSEVRRRASRLARRLGFDETREAEVALIVTEAATNLVKHGREGQIVATPIEADGRPGIELLALDRGPGMENVQACLVDGFSTSGTPGTGLGAIRRLADEFDVSSSPGQGTAVLARVWKSAAARGTSAPIPLELGAVCLPIADEEVSGDAWTAWPHPTAPRLLVVDGLGHGAGAAEAAAAAVASFHAHAGQPLTRLLEVMHNALRATRGAVAGIAELDVPSGTIHFAGIGNIAGVVAAPGNSRNVVSMSGTMGHTAPSIREFAYPWPEDALLVMHSDGLGSRWSIDDYRGLAGRDPSLVAGVLYRDHVRGRDDVTVLVARRRKAA